MVKPLRHEVFLTNPLPISTANTSMSSQHPESIDARSAPPHTTMATAASTASRDGDADPSAFVDSIAFPKPFSTDGNVYVNLPFPDRILRANDPPIVVTCASAAALDIYQQGLLDLDLAIANVLTTGAEAQKQALSYTKQKGIISTESFINDPVFENPRDKVPFVRDCVIPPFVCHGDNAIDVGNLLQDLRNIGRLDGKGRVMGLVILTRCSYDQQCEDDPYSLDLLSCETDTQPTDHFFFYREWLEPSLGSEQGPEETWRALLPLSLLHPNLAFSKISTPQRLPSLDQQATAGASIGSESVKPKLSAAQITRDSGVTLDTRISDSTAAGPPPMMDPLDKPHISLSSSPVSHPPPLPSYGQQQRHWLGPDAQTYPQDRTAPQVPSGYLRAAYLGRMTSPTQYVQQYQQWPGPPDAPAPLAFAAYAGPLPVPTVQSTSANPTSASSTLRARKSSRKSPAVTPSPALTPEQQRILTLEPARIVGETLLQLASAMRTEHVKEHVDKLYDAKGVSRRGLNTFTKNITNAIKSRALRQGRPYEDVGHEFNLQRKANGIKVNVAAAESIATLVNSTNGAGIITAPGTSTNAATLAWSPFTQSLTANPATTHAMGPQSHAMTFHPLHYTYPADPVHPTYPKHPAYSTQPVYAQAPGATGAPMLGTFQLTATPSSATDNDISAIGAARSTPRSALPASAKPKHSENEMYDNSGPQI